MGSYLNGREVAMMKGIDVAFYRHAACNTRFFAMVASENAKQYKGKCPNPNCGRRVVLRPLELYASTDRARRKYIKLSRGLKAKIFWHA
jgi:hypothetical protein